MTELMMTVSPIDTGQYSAQAAFIRTLLVPHEVWCEPYFKMGEVFFRKLPSRKEIINDADHNLVNFYLMIRSRWEQLHFLMEGTLHCDYFTALADSLLADEKADNLYRAWAFWLQCSRAFVPPERWSVDDVLPAGPLTGGSLQRKALSALSDRLRDVYISARDPLQVIREADGEGTLFYICPHTKRDLVLLEPVLKGLKGRFILQTTEQQRRKKMAAGLGFYTDQDCMQWGVYLNFVRQRSLFE